MWLLFLLIGFVAAIGLSVLASKMRRFMRAMASLGVDDMDIMKRVPDKSFVDYTDTKFGEKVQLFKFRMMKLFREREAAETDEQEKKFWQKAGELLNNEKAKWGLVREVAVPRGRLAHILWRLGLNKRELEPSFDITLAHKYRTGKSEERCVVRDLPKSIIAEFDDLVMCNEAIQ